MVITHPGGNCFKLSAGDTTIAVNPPSGASKHKISKFGSNIVLISAEHEDWNGVETASHGASVPFVIRGPGAYEVGDVVVAGYASHGSLGKETSMYRNTVYLLKFDGMKALILGALSSAKLPQEIRSDVDDIDIVFVPLGGNTLDAKDAHDLSVALEAKLVLPYPVDGATELKEFITIAGVAGLKPQEKITLRSKDIAAMSGEVVVLQ